MPTYYTDPSSYTDPPAWASSPLGDPAFEDSDPFAGADTTGAVTPAARSKSVARGATLAAALACSIGGGAALGVALFVYADSARPAVVVPGSGVGFTAPNAPRVIGPGPDQAVSPNVVVPPPDSSPQPETDCLPTR